jgi:hypothetical protein
VNVVLNVFKIGNKVGIVEIQADGDLLGAAGCDIEL